jgi:hypothetical protein
MAYRIEGLPPQAFEAFTGLSDFELAVRGVRRVTADRKPGFPCRVSLEDAEPRETLFLLNHVSLDAATPFRSAYAIYVRERARKAACFEDALPPVFDGRSLSLRGFDREGMLRHARLAAPGEADGAIRELLRHDEIDQIHARNAAAGCFAARIVRS